MIVQVATSRRRLQEARREFVCLWIGTPSRGYNSLLVFGRSEVATDVKRVRVIRKRERAQVPTAQTPGIRREQAIADEHVWVGAVATEPNNFSGWHHHGEYDTYVYIVSGRARVEFGPGGREHADAGPDDFVHIPKLTVHREGNPDETEARAVLVRVGSGQALFNVEGPEEERP